MKNLYAAISSKKSQRVHPATVWRSVLEVTADHYQVNIEDLFADNKRRLSDMVYARQAFMYFMRTHKSWLQKPSVLFLAKVLGYKLTRVGLDRHGKEKFNYDHTSVMHGVKRFANLLEVDATLPKRLIKRMNGVRAQEDFSLLKQKIYNNCF